MDGCLHVRNAYRVGSTNAERRTFDDFLYRESLYDDSDVVGIDNPLDCPAFRRDLRIPVDACDSLINYLEKQAKKAAAVQKRSRSDSIAGTGAGTQSSARRKRGGSVTSTGTDVTQEDVTQEDEPEAAAIRDFFRDTRGELSLMYVIKSRAGNHKFNLPNTDELDYDTPIFSLRHLFRGLSSPMNEPDLQTVYISLPPPPID